jgi:hypothetical protein
MLHSMDILIFSSRLCRSPAENPGFFLPEYSHEACASAHFWQVGYCRLHLILRRLQRSQLELLLLIRPNSRKLWQKFTYAIFLFRGAELESSMLTS